MNRVSSLTAASLRTLWAHSTRLLLPPVGVALSLRRNIAWVFVGNVVYALSQWLILIVLAKLGTLEMVGQYAFAVALASPIIIFSNLRLRWVVAVDTQREYRFGDYFGLRLSTTFVALVVVALLALIAPNSTSALVLLAVACAKGFESISDLLYGRFQLDERLDFMAKSMLLRGVLAVVAFALGMGLGGSVVWGALGVCLAWGFILLVYDLPNTVSILRFSTETGANRLTAHTARALLRPHWDTRVLRRLVLLTLPLGFVVALDTFWNYIPRYFIEFDLGERELGVFAAVASLMSFGGLVVNALGQPAVPRLAKYYSDGNWKASDALLLKLLGGGAIIGILGVVVAVVAGSPLLGFLYRPEYASDPNLLPIVMLAAGIQYVYIFCATALIAMHQFKIQVPLHLTSVLLITALCFYLIPRLGLLGAAWAMLGANGFEALVYTGAFLYYRRQTIQQKGFA